MTDVTRDFEFRATREDTDGDGHTLEGYAAVFNQDTVINSWEGRFTERVAPGAFKKTLRERKPIMQYDHGQDSRVGSVPIGKFTSVKEDDHGLYVEGRLFSNSLVEPVRQAIEGEAVTGMSFKFKVVRDEWRDAEGKLLKGEKLRQMLWDGAEGLVRTIKEVKLFEAGPVATPAYAGTTVGVRSAKEIPEEQRDELFKQYQRTMIEPTGTETRNDDDDEGGEQGSFQLKHDVEVWLRAEAEFNWLQAEKEWRTNVESWLEAEKTYPEDEAARTSTSDDQENPENEAAHRSTSDREPTHKETERKAPRIKRTRVMTLAELNEMLADANARKAAIETNEEYRDAEMPEEARKQYDEAVAEIAAVEARIQGIKDWQAKIKGTPASHTEEGSKVTTHVRKAENTFDIDEIRKLAYNDDDRVKLMRDHAKRAIDESEFGGTSQVDEADAKNSALKVLNRYDNQANVLAERYLVTGSEVYQRAWAKAAAAGNPQILLGEEARALSLGTDGAGGYAVPFQLDPTVIWTDLGIQDPIRANARVEKITGKEFHGVKGDAATVTRAAEAAEAPDSSFALTNYTVRTNRVHGFVPFSYELAESWDAVLREITHALNYAKAVEEAESFALGTGAGVNAAGLIKLLDSGSKVDTASGTAFAASDVYKLEEALDVRYRQNAKFLAHHATYNAVRQFGTTDGHALWERIGNKQPNQLLGYDALESSVVAASGANFSDWAPISSLLATTPANGNDTENGQFMLFGDFSNFLIVDRIGMSVELIPQVFGATNQFPTGQRGIYAIWMNNSKIVVDNAFRLLKLKDMA